MLKIRFQRFGRRNQPTFRMVLVDSHAGPKSGNFVELLGSYDPKTKHTTLKGERALYWIEKGAQVSETAHNFLVKNRVLRAGKISVASKKNVKSPEEIAAQKAAEEAKNAPAPVVEAPVEEPAQEPVAA